VLSHVEFCDHVIPPQNVGIVRGGRDRRLAGRHAVAGFVQKRPAVAVRHAGGIETHHLAAATDRIHAVALDRRRRADAAAGPIPIDAGGDFRHDQLPEQSAGTLIQTHQHAAVSDMARIARPPVVGADVDASAGHDRRGVGLGADFRDPAHVASGRGVERLRQPRLGGNHVARKKLTPLRLVGCARQRNVQTGCQRRETGCQAEHAAARAAPPPDKRTQKMFNALHACMIT